MSDYERYGDYNEIDDDSAPSGGKLMLALKIITLVLCATVVGIIVFRLVSFNVYPASVSGLYFNDTLTEHYNADPDGFEVKTQTVRYIYDDEDEGNFFCEYLYVIPDAGQLQITVRYNKATVERIAAERELELDSKDESLFKFRLVDNYGRVLGTLSDTVYDSNATYRYIKLVFDGVDFAPDSEGKFPEWIRLETLLATDDFSTTEPYMNLIYENHEGYCEFLPYEPKSSELPE